MDWSTPGFPILCCLRVYSNSFELVMPSNYLILCHPLLLLPSIFPSIRAFSKELALHIRWSKYWSFSYSIRPFNEYSGLVCFRIDWFDLLAVQGILAIKYEVYFSSVYFPLLLPLECSFHKVEVFACSVHFNFMSMKKFL